jgi:hypothetical protein
MVDKNLIGQLQSLNATQRKEAILALGRTKDREAIPHLSRVVETDPDDELRELARKAAIYIDKNAPVVNVKPFRMPWDDEDEEDAPAAPMGAAAAAVLNEYTPPTPDEIAEQQDREWAERFVERAWQSYYTHDREGAETNLRKAFERSPDIAEEPEVRAAAGKIMNMNPDRAVAVLLKPKSLRRAKGDTGGVRTSTGSIRQSTGTTRPPTGATRPPTAPVYTPPSRTSAKPPRERREKTVDEIEDGSGLTLLRDLLIYFVIVTAFNALLVATFYVSNRDDILPPGTPGYTFVDEAFTNIAVGGVLPLLGYAMVLTAGAAVQMLFWSFIMHVVATTLLGGNSTFPRLINQTYLYHALSTPLIVGLFMIGAAYAAAQNDLQPIFTALGIAILISVFWLAFRLGVAYRFDFALGCFTMILSQVAMACCGITITLTLAVAGVEPLATQLQFIINRR